MPRGTADLEGSVIAQLRKAAVDRLPVDAGLCERAAGIVRAAYARGGQDTALALAQAYQLSLADGDLDALADALADLLPAGCGPPDGAADLPAPYEDGQAVEYYHADTGKWLPGVFLGWDAGREGELARVAPGDGRPGSDEGGVVRALNLRPREAGRA